MDSSGITRHHESKATGPKTREQAMKTVVFASVYDAARSKMAAAFFNAFTMPSLVRAVSGGARPLLWVAPEVVQIMREIEFDVETRPQLLPAEALESAALIVTFSDADAWRTPPDVPRESWDLPDPRNLPIERLRELRDRLRDRVWRLVAKQGWYRLQPARAAMRSRRQEAIQST
jgi:arsenate reductase